MAIGHYPKIDLNKLICHKSNATIILRHSSWPLGIGLFPFYPFLSQFQPEKMF